MGIREKLENLFSNEEQPENPVYTYDSQEPRELHELHMDNMTVRLNVPVRYTRMEDEDPAYAAFSEVDQAKLFFCRIEEAFEDESIEEYMQDELEVEIESKNLDDVTVKCESLQGRVYFYYVYPFKSGLSHYQKLYAACDLDSGKIYTVETTWLGRKDALSLDALLPFLELEVV